MPTMKIPGLGTVERKYVYIGAAVVAGFAGYMWYKSKTAVDTSTQDTEGALDPALADVAGTDYSGAYGDFLGSYDMSSSTPIYQSPPSVFVPVPTDQQITTNGAWDAAAIDLAADLGIDNTTGQLSGALGRYLASQCLTAQQADWVRAVEGRLGKPPQSPNLTINLCPATPPTQGGKKGSELSAPTGLHATGVSKSHVRLTWNKVDGAVSYRLYRSDVSVNVGASTDTSAEVGGLSRCKTYKFHVRAIGVDGAYGPSSATVSGKTKC